MLWRTVRVTRTVRCTASSLAPGLASVSRWSRPGNLLSGPAQGSRRGLRASHLPSVDRPEFGHSFFALGGWTGLLWGGLVRMLFVHHVTWNVNSVCHTFGRRTYATTDRSRNQWTVGLLAMGEGWHNNHHALEFASSCVVKGAAAPSDLETNLLRASAYGAIRRTSVASRRRSSAVISHVAGRQLAPTEVTTALAIRTGWCWSPVGSCGVRPGACAT